jgi:hypothetical protein
MEEGIIGVIVCDWNTFKAMLQAAIPKIIEKNRPSIFFPKNIQ